MIQNTLMSQFQWKNTAVKESERNVRQNLHEHSE